MGWVVLGYRIAPSALAGRIRGDFEGERPL